MAATITSRQFNQDVSSAKRLADREDAVIITDRGEPRYVLVTYESYKRRVEGSKGRSILEALAYPGVEDIEFDPPRLGTETFRPADLD